MVLYGIHRKEKNCFSSTSKPFMFTFHVNMECLNIQYATNFSINTSNWINCIWIEESDVTLFRRSSQFWKQICWTAKKTPLCPYIKTMIINPLPSNRGFHSNCAAFSLQCCKRSMMIYPVESVFVFVFNGYTALMKPLSQKSTNRICEIAQNYSPGLNTVASSIMSNVAKSNRCDCRDFRTGSLAHRRVSLIGIDCDQTHEI